MKVSSMWCSNMSHYDHNAEDGSGQNNPALVSWRVDIEFNLIPLLIAICTLNGCHTTCLQLQKILILTKKIYYDEFF